MAPFEEVRYKRTFLKQVVARINFLSPLKGVATTLPPELSKAVLEKFPISEPQKAIARQLQISRKEFATKQSEFTRWQFHGREREKTFLIEPGATTLEDRRYTTYEDFRTDFLSLVTKQFESFTDAQPSRLGLRYINVVELKDGDPLNWSDYIDPRMLCLFNFTPEPERKYLTRVFHNIELAYDDVSLRYQFGIPNPDYPARIKQRTFVLDLDAYVQGAIDRDGVAGLLDTCHACIQDHFERSITDQTRGLLNAG